MADINYITPCGLIQDTEEGSEVIMPNIGIYNEQEAASSADTPWHYYAQMQALRQFGD